MALHTKGTRINLSGDQVSQITGYSLSSSRYRSRVTRCCKVFWFRQVLGQEIRGGGPSSDWIQAAQGLATGLPKGRSHQVQCHARSRPMPVPQASRRAGAAERRKKDIVSALLCFPSLLYSLMAGEEEKGRKAHNKHLKTSLNNAETLKIITPPPFFFPKLHAPTNSCPGHRKSPT
jgi:hypothetical protein